MMVGDSLEFDVAGANAMGMHSVWITRRVHNWEEQLAGAVSKPDFVIANLRELSVYPERT
jgi:FMN phosphatase YigB (HAD superfamily)